MPARRRRQATRAVGTRAKQPRSGDDVYARAETLAPARERMRAGDNVCARATTGGTWEGCFFTNTTLLRRRLRPGDNACVRTTTYACARATTSVPVRRRVPRGRGVFHQHPKLQRSSDNASVRATTSACARATTHAPGRQRLHLCDDECRMGGVFFHKHPKLQRSCDNGCARATTSALTRRCLDPIVLTLAFFFAFAIQTKLFHYLFSRITQIVLKMVIQSYFY